MQDPIFGRLQVGEHFQWGRCPEIFERIRQRGTRGLDLANARAVAGPRAGQTFYFGPGERVHLVEVVDPDERPSDGKETG